MHQLTGLRALKRLTGCGSTQAGCELRAQGQSQRGTMTSHVNKNRNHVQQKATLPSSRNNCKRMNWHKTY